MTQPQSQQGDDLTILRYMQQKSILIVDSSIATRTTIINILKDLGARWTNIQQMADLASAEKSIESTPPDIVIWEPSIDQKGLDLVRRLPVACLSIAVSQNASSATVVEAIEAGVDYYIVKPFTANSFREHFIRAALNSTISNPRNEKIEEGLSEWAKGERERAQAIFSEVLQKDEKSLYARFYLGKLLHEQKDHRGAIEQFEAALALSPNNFRCLLGLYDAVLALGEKASAYEVAKRIFSSFPLSRKRLEEILELALETSHLEDVDILYKNYVNIDSRSQLLADKMVTILIQGAKLALKNGTVQVACNFLRRALVSSGRSVGILRKVILLLLEEKQAGAASELLSEAPSEQKLDPELRALALRIADSTDTPEQVFEAGVKLVKEGVLHPDIHQILIEKAMSLGKTDYADHLKHEADKLFRS